MPVKVGGNDDGRCLVQVDKNKHKTDCREEAC